MQALLTNLERQFSETQDATIRLQAVSTARDQLLQLRVPSEDKDVHLELAVLFTQLIDALRQGSDVTALFQQFESIRQQTDWLRS